MQSRPLCPLSRCHAERNTCFRTHAARVHRCVITMTPSQRGEHLTEHRHKSLNLGQNSQQEPGVGDHLSNPSCVAGDDGHNVWDEMCNSAEW